MTASVVIAGGGTAGHVYPGIALAHALRELQPDIRITFVGTHRGIETIAVPAAGFELRLIDVLPFAKTIGIKRFLSPLSLARAQGEARALLAEVNASVVVGVGGYASMPSVVAARLRGVPVVLQEQNAVAGLANVGAARLWTHANVALAFSEARSGFPSGARVRVTGNPVRRSIADFDGAALRADARAQLGFDLRVPLVIIFGGSLGASRLNDAAVGIARLWSDRADRKALLIAGTSHVDAVAAQMPAGSPVHVRAFLDRMELAYAAADVVVCRAGAMTVAEIAATGSVAVFVPYPFARRDHQTSNARSLARRGAALVVPDADASIERVHRLIEGILSDDERRAAMSAAAREAGKPHAARDLATWVIDVAEGHRG